MPDFQVDVLDKIARVVGGTVSTQDPSFFSGAMAGDSTGVAGLTGCYASPPDGIQAVPVAIVLPGPFKADLASIGEEDNQDDVRLLVLVSASILESQNRVLVPYRDSVPAAFRAHMQLFGNPSALDAFVTGGNPGVHEWGKTPYLAWEFTVRVRRFLPVTYVP